MSHHADKTEEHCAEFSTAWGYLGNKLLEVYVEYIPRKFENIVFDFCFRSCGAVFKISLRIILMI